MLIATLDGDWGEGTNEKQAVLEAQSDTRPKTSFESR